MGGKQASMKFIPKIVFANLLWYNLTPSPSLLQFQRTALPFLHIQPVYQLLGVMTLHYLNSYYFHKSTLNLGPRSGRNRVTFPSQGCCLYATCDTTGNQTCWTCQPHLNFSKLNCSWPSSCHNASRQAADLPSPTTTFPPSQHAVCRCPHASQRRPRHDNPCTRDGGMDEQQDVALFCTRDPQRSSAACGCIPEFDPSHLSFSQTDHRKPGPSAFTSSSPHHPSVLRGIYSF